MYAGAFTASRRSPSRVYQHGQQQNGINHRASRQQHSWLQSSVARRLFAESHHQVKRPSTEPTSNDERGSAPKGRSADGWLDSPISTNAPSEGPGITAEGKYLPSSKAKYEAASAALQRRRSMGGQKFYSNYGNGYHDEDGFDNYNNQQVPITAWNQPGASEFGAGAHDRGYSLPDNVTLVTLEEVENGDVLLRLAHLYEEGEHRELSKPAYIDIRLLFQGCQAVTEGFILRMRSAIWTEEDALATPNAEQGQKRTEAEEEEVLKAKLKESMKFPQYICFSIPGGAPPAQKVHTDYTPNGARTHIRKYHPKLRSAAADIIKAEEHLLSKGLALKDHYSTSPDCPRWALFSIWRPLKPVKRDPLGLGDVRSFAKEDFVSVNVRWPNLGVPGGTTDVHEVEMHLGRGSERHRWCWVSNQQPEEVVVIGFFDSRREKDSVAAGGVLHSSMVLEGTEHEKTRESIELRCLAIW